MATCPRCSQENPDGFRFCGACGAPLTDDAPGPREERKVVTVLFCDLVGSTARAERLDPEDVRALLSSFLERVRGDLERFGGTVEKFIGDAVMALFGAPAAHEDDPERAVRAALAIRDWALEEADLEVRIGITTGEALITLGAGSAEGMASGDVVNTASRLQSAAPVNGILVDATTYRATERAIAYREQRPIEAKGKAEPVEVWEAVEARARFGVDVRQIGRTPLVGREAELEALVGALDRARREREPQLVTLVGVPGIGKSRLVWELFGRIEQGSELTRWRQGRSLPYGDGVSYWALGEMVKAQAGVLETDDAARTEAKLREAVATLVPDADEQQWLERHLKPLVGLESSREVASDLRWEAFAAWRTFFEALAEERPLVLVFEDLHFADDGLLDFVDHLVDWASGVPLFVVGTARPELLARRPGWGGGKPHALTLSLSPLSDEETAQLVRGFLARTALESSVEETLLDRAAGNPLYAEEFARLLEGHEHGQELRVPETVQGLLAARIDALEPDEKAILQDAAVLGKVFWLGAAAALAGVERWVAEERLHALDRKEFIRRERRSSVAGETEYAFRHLLVRDVAYGQIPRASRAEKHRQAAVWTASLARPEDQAEMVAYHYLSALELLRAAGSSYQRKTVLALIEALIQAGDRAFALNAFDHAQELYEQALELLGDHPNRTELVFRRARALHLAADDRQFEALEAARDALLAAGRRDDAAEAQALVARARWYRGSWDGARDAYDRAVALLDDGPPTPARARVHALVAGFRGLEGDYEEAIRVGRDALAAADALGLEAARAAPLATIGAARVDLGDEAGLADTEEARRVALEAGELLEAARACNNIAVNLFGAGELTRSFDLIDEGLALAERAGHSDMIRFARGMSLLRPLETGSWDDCVRIADEFIAECEAGAPHTLQASVHCHRGHIRLARDDVDGAVADAERALELGREVAQPDRLFQSLAFAVRVFAAAGERERARELALEFDFAGLDGRRPPPSWSWTHLVWAAADVGLTKELDDLLARQRRQTRWIAAGRAVLRDEYVTAAELFGEMGTRPHEAYARLKAASNGSGDEPDEHLANAVAFFRKTEAKRWLREVEIGS
jgi:class 3 adenylate cyclase/tetratricopeptide (TPR) repeat protein